MDISTVSILVAIISAVSASAERGVQILQDLLGGYLGLGPLPDTNPDPKKESLRKVVILILSFGCCQATAFLSIPLLFKDTNTATGPIAEIMKNPYAPFAIGVLAMGGASFWNNIQGYLNGIKKGAQSISDSLKQAQDKISAADKLEVLANAETDAGKKATLQTNAKTLRDAAATLLAGVGE